MDLPSVLAKVSVFIAARKLVREEGTLTGALRMMEESPQGAMYLTQHTKRTKKGLRKLLPPKPVEPHPLCRDLEIYTNLPQWDRSKVLILHGRSGTGKTSLAVSILRTPLIVSQMEDLSTFSVKRHSGIVFDDCDWIKDLERYQQIHLVDLTVSRSYPARYRNARIPAGVPRIITTNLHTRELLPVWLDEIKRRTQCVCVMGFNDFHEQWNGLEELPPLV